MQSRGRHDMARSGKGWREARQARAATYHPTMQPWTPSPKYGQMVQPLK